MKMIDLHEIKTRFTYHRPIEQTYKDMDRIRIKGFRFAESLLAWLPPSRERSIALRKIEEAVHWAQAAVLRKEAEKG